jgi:hypothetical protein
VLDGLQQVDDSQSVAGFGIVRVVLEAGCESLFTVVEPAFDEVVSDERLIRT